MLYRFLFIPFSILSPCRLIADLLYIINMLNKEIVHLLAYNRLTIYLLKRSFFKTVLVILK